MTITLENDVLISRKEAARELGMTTRTIDRYRHQGLIEATKIGNKKVMVSQNSIQRFLDECQKKRSAVTH